jgi:hypothetical protein
MGLTVEGSSRQRGIGDGGEDRIWLSAYRLSAIAIRLSGYGPGYRPSGDRVIDDCAIAPSGHR